MSTSSEQSTTMQVVHTAPRRSTPVRRRAGAGQAPGRRTLALLLLLALGVSACSLVGLQTEVNRVLSEAGLPESSGVNAAVTNGVDTLQVSFTTDVDADDVAEALWEGLPYSFDQLQVVADGVPASFAASSLESRHGPRPASLDQSSVGDVAAEGVGQVFLGLGIFALFGLLFLVGIIVLVVVLVRRNGRNKRPPFPPGGSGPYGSPPPGQPGQPGPYGSR